MAGTDWITANSDATTITTAWTVWASTSSTNAASTNTTWTTNISPSWPPSPKEEAARKRRKKQEEEAEAKATALLHEHLSDEQRASYKESQRVRVTAKSGRVYEMDCNRRQHNIFLLNEEGQRLREYCIYQEGYLPLPDNHLGQLLLLQADEERFLRIANERILQQAA